MQPTYESENQNDALGGAQPVLPGMVPEDEEWPEPYEEPDEEEPEAGGESAPSVPRRDRVKARTERRGARRREQTVSSGVNGLPPIKVIGIGGGGCNALNRMIAEDVAGVQFVGINTDAQALARCEAGVRIRIGDKLTKGLGVGGDPDKGERAAEESRDELLDALKGAEIVFAPNAASLDSHALWERAIGSNAFANNMFIFRVNRVGQEEGISFYGRSFCMDPWGEMCSELAGGKDAIVLADIDLKERAAAAETWGFLKHRRPSEYGELVK